MALSLALAFLAIQLRTAHCDLSNFQGINVALNRPVSQWPGTDGNNFAWHAVDGTIYTDLSKGSCAHTGPGNKGGAGWSVDLGQPFIIKGIRIYNRNDADNSLQDYQERLKNFEVIGYPGGVVLYNDSSNQAPRYRETIISITISDTRSYRNITVEIPASANGPVYLTLCEVQIFIVGGGWTDWSSWSSCSVTCGGSGLSTRTRACTNPAPLYSGEHCFGNAKDTKSCYISYYCPIDGGWTDWSSWSSCSVTCGGSGLSTRTRACTNPAPLYSGEHCFGNAKNTKSCFISYYCPIDGVWTFWSAWSGCSVTCSSGQSSRTRACTNPAPQYSGENCTGRATEEKQCNIGNCPVDGGWTAWTAMISCSVTCGSGLFNRTRACANPAPQNSGENCIGNATEEIHCNIGHCPEEQKSVPAAAIGGGVGAALVILVVVVLVLFLIVRKRRSAIMKESGSEHSHDYHQSTTDSGEINAYAGIANTSIEMKENSGSKSDMVDVNEEGSEHEYYCFTNPLKVPERGIKLQDLSDFVLSTNEDNVKYTTEFESLPDGMKKPHKAALRNKDRNRYKNIYAYDDTRVILEIWNPKTETDYINANYIHGFSEQKAYIASQGVTKDNLNDFWRMVWQVDSGKIVMLTNVWEELKVKCIKYWPDEGTESYGNIAVTLDNTEAFSNFVIRTLVIKKDNDKQRRVLQFHFTAWPDRGVPKYPSALVHFRSKVKSATTTCKGPPIVHCSAGIGRTGTFIALDYLTDQGRALGMVDVAGCVETLRRQRVDMVQTKEQYVLIHQALVETLMLSTSALPAGKFPEAYQDMLAIDPVKRKRKLDIEFQMIGNMSPTPEEAQYVTAKEVRNRNKNRYSNNLPIVEYMPSLHGPGVSPESGYINAVFLPSYKDKNALIVTQSPLETTKEDFWTMVFNQDVHTIVMMNSVAELKEKEIYWPQTEEVTTFGDIEVIRTGSENKSRHVVLTLMVTKNNKNRTIEIVQFGKWDSGKEVPDDPRDILTAIELVQDWQRHTGNHAVVVHCMDGTKKSGLFCLLYALLERTKIEHDVAVTQVIQEMRNRREQIVPNVAQFQFCHEVVLEYLKQFETYSNLTEI